MHKHFHLNSSLAVAALRLLPVAQAGCIAAAKAAFGKS
jgi:hypothetical protein